MFDVFDACRTERWGQSWPRQRAEGGDFDVLGVRVLGWFCELILFFVFLCRASWRAWRVIIRTCWNLSPPRSGSALRSWGRSRSVLILGVWSDRYLCYLQLITVVLCWSFLRFLLFLDILFCLQLSASLSVVLSLFDWKMYWFSVHFILKFVSTSFVSLKSCWMYIKIYLVHWRLVLSLWIVVFLWILCSFRFLLFYKIKISI